MDRYREIMERKRMKDQIAKLNCSINNMEPNRKLEEIKEESGSSSDGQTINHFEETITYNVIKENPYKNIL